MTSQAYIGLGSNLAGRQSQILQALHSIQHNIGNITACSSLYETPPMGPQDQPHYLNAVIALDTALGANALLDALQHIEQQQGRPKEHDHWGARTIDLDILLFDDLVQNDPQLTLPHPGLHLRSFVLYPLFEIAPDLHIPQKGTVLQNLEQLSDIAPTIVLTNPLENIVKL